LRNQIQRRIFFLLIGLALFAVLAFVSPEASQKHYVQFQSVYELQEYLAWSPEKTPLIGAHRGGPMPGYPENALETFEHTLTYAPCLLEIDVRKTRDGRLVLMHDKTLDRTTTGKGPIGAYTYAELQQFHLVDPEGTVTPYKIPTLKDALLWAKGKAILQLDVKEPVTFEQVVDSVELYGAEAYVVIITYNLRSAQRVHQLNSGLVISASAKGIEGTRRLLASDIPARNLIAFVGVGEPNPEVYRMLHERGIRAILGTFGNLDRRAQRRGPQVYVKLLQNGADVLATDNVPLAARAIEAFIHQRMQLEPVR